MKILSVTVSFEALITKKEKGNQKISFDEFIQA